MRKLYWQIYLTFIGILLLFGVLVSFGVFARDRDTRGVEALASLAETILPAADAPAADVEAVLSRLRDRLHVSAAVWEGNRLVAAVGESLPPPDESWRRSRFLQGDPDGFTLALALSDGRWVIARHERGPHGPAGAVVVVLLLGVAVAVGAYPLVRRLTGRLERLQRRVEALGSGELSTRVDVEGRDEVAELATSFNQAAQRIETLVTSQKMLLAGASHELRSPLTRIRLGLELLDDCAPAELRERMAADIAELDELLAELLLVSKLDAAPAAERFEPVDLLSLSREEAAAVGAEVTGDEVTVEGSERLLRRLLRNLLTNAERHGRPPIELALVHRDAEDEVRITVSDAGAGIPMSERESVFEPFVRGARTLDSEAADGVGLGLAIVSRIARAHGGEARVVERAGAGTVIEVRLQASRKDGNKKAGEVAPSGPMR